MKEYNFHLLIIFICQTREFNLIQYGIILWEGNKGLSESWCCDLKIGSILPGHYHAQRLHHQGDILVTCETFRGQCLIYGHEVIEIMSLKVTGFSFPFFFVEKIFLPCISHLLPKSSNKWVVQSHVPAMNSQDSKPWDNQSLVQDLRIFKSK